MKRIRVTVSGKVQGVWFRKCTCDAAIHLGLSGWVKNLKNGSVQIEAQGTDAQLSQLLEWCKTGSPLAEVTGIQKNDIPTQEELGFLILR